MVAQDSWNPRYLTYCRSQGFDDPDAMLAHDRERYSGGCMYGFILWIAKHKRAFEEIHGPQTTCYPGGTPEADRWDQYLQEKTL